MRLDFRSKAASFRSPVTTSRMSQSEGHILFILSDHSEQHLVLLYFRYGRRQYFRVSSAATVSEKTPVSQQEIAYVTAGNCLCAKKRKISPRYDETLASATKTP